MAMGFDERIVITGMGVVSPLGTDLDRFHQSLSEGRSGITAIDFPWKTGYQTNRAGLVPDFDLSEWIDQGESFDKSTRFALAACKMALDHSQFLSNGRRERLGVVVGTALGQALQMERLRQDERADNNRRKPLPEYAYVNIDAHIVEVLGLGGPNHLVATTCAAGNHAISWASDVLKFGAADAMLAVGADTIGFVDLLGFSRLLLQAPQYCQPFDLHRKGTILAEGAGAILLEPLRLAKQRGAEILAEVAGCGLSCDAAGPFDRKTKDIQSLEIAANRALKEAQCSPDDIHYISAHGSGTRLNDAKETYFIKSLFGDRAYHVPVSSIKSMLGHAQGAASSLEAIASVLSFEHDILYPTINYQTPDPECDLDYIPNQARECRVDTIMSNAFGVGGNNAVVILKRWSGK